MKHINSMYEAKEVIKHISEYIKEGTNLKAGIVFFEDCIAGGIDYRFAISDSLTEIKLWLDSREQDYDKCCIPCCGYYVEFYQGIFYDMVFSTLT